MQILLITGMSGAGKSVALKTFEDIGYEAIDNVPLSLIPALLDSTVGESHNLAIGTDARSRDFSRQHFEELITTLREQRGSQVQVLFFDCDNEVLRRRFTETRRKHPLALDRPVMDGIQHERGLLYPLRDMADFTFDTSEWASADLRQAIREHYGEKARELSVFVRSFSFKRGVPRDADLVFDVRFLRNPFYDDNLRDLTGLDNEVVAYIQNDTGFEEFFTHLTQLIEPLLPRYLQEGKTYLTIAIGCTGGRHRSVCVAEKLAGFLKKKEYKVGIRHRDITVGNKES